MSAPRRRYRYPDRVPFVTVPARRARPRPLEVSVRELRWTARLSIVTQLAYLIGRLPRTGRLAAVVFLGCAGYSVALLVYSFRWWLVAAAVAYLIYRLTGPRWRRWRQYRADSREANAALDPTEWDEQHRNDNRR